MDTSKVYKDSNDNECSIWQMVKREPEWSANRIQAGEDALNSLQQLQAEIRALHDEFRELYDGDFSGEAVSLLLTKMFELSAVQ